MPPCMHSCIDESLPIRHRFRRHRRPPSHARIPRGKLYRFVPHRMQLTLLGQVFGHKDPSLPMGYNISPGRQQLISSLMTLGAFISSTGAGFAATWLGRRQCLWIASVLCCVSNVIMMATTNLSGLYAGRFLIGLANGWYMTFAQLYIQVPLVLLPHGGLPLTKSLRKAHQPATADL